MGRRTAIRRRPTALLSSATRPTLVALRPSTDVTAPVTAPSASLDRRDNGAAATIADAGGVDPPVDVATAVTTISAPR